MITLRETKENIEREPQWWQIHLANFIDDFRRYGDPAALVAPFERNNEKIDAVLASTAESLCDEIGVNPPSWLSQVPECAEPYFVGEMERLKAISIVESPLRFRMRKIFVLENFLSRV
jgi:hypothetical protein